MSRSWKLILPFVVIAFAGLGGAGLLATAPEVEQIDRPELVRAVRVVEAVREAQPLIVRSQGTVAPRTESELVSEVSGRIVWSSPSLVSGGFYRNGEPLLRLDRADYETALARARANLERAKGESEHANASLGRREELARQGVASSSQLDDARRQARVSAAVVDEAELALRQAGRDLERTEISAPFDGRVRDERVDVGQFLSRGQAIATLYATDYVEIRLPIPDDELAYLDLPLFAGADLEKGPPVLLRARFAGAPHVWQGRIVRTEGEIDAKSRMVHAVARVQDPYGKGIGSAPLAVGLFVEAEIEGAVPEDVIRVPRGALQGGRSLLVVDGKDELHQIEVEVLRLERDDALVRATLPPGGRVCVSQVSSFVPGMKVKPQAAMPSPAPEGAPTRAKPIEDARL